MGLFVCEECFCIENTSLGKWWSRDSKSIWGEDDDGRALCSADAPTSYGGGEPTRYGAWHGRFDRDRATEADRGRVKNPEVLDRPAYKDSS